LNPDDPWTLYWQGGPLHSCIASQDQRDQVTIDALWIALAESLPPSAQVLDLACGNGAVPRSLLAARRDLAITAVDLAEIAPDRLLAAFEQLAHVRFIPRTDICRLPFPDEQFDAATSQFGLEYAPRSAALREAARVLRPGAMLRLLMHHSDSGVVRPAAAVIAEIEQLFQPAGLLEALQAFIAGRCSLEQLEAAGQAYLVGPQARTRHVSGQVLTGIDQIIRDIRGKPARARALAASMQTRLQAERLRLTQLQTAALGEAEMADFRALAEHAGFRIGRVAPLRAGDEDAELVGWEFSAQRK
jgi:ubiquinone/menaquinone biosynthesis C-methylase UbiE